MEVKSLSAWAVMFALLSVISCNKIPDDRRFVDNNNGTVTDTRTGLIWLKKANPCYRKDWADAVAYCSSLKNGGAGLTDGSAAGQWRLPSIQ
ncbi:MAG: DUF1566 domain-containing protein, partial [Pseudomonadota bacterium]